MQPSRLLLCVSGDYGKQQIEAGSKYSVRANNNINVALILKDVYNENRKFFIILPPHTTSAIQQTVYIPLNTGSIMSEFNGTTMQSYYVHNTKSTNLSERVTVTHDMVAYHSTSFESDKYYTVYIAFNDQNQWVVFPGPRHFNSARESVSNKMKRKMSFKNVHDPYYYFSRIWVATWQNQQSDCAPSLGICPVWSESSLCA